jgi:hypothetical protein
MLTAHHCLSLRTAASLSLSLSLSVVPHGASRASVATRSDACVPTLPTYFRLLLGSRTEYWTLWRTIYRYWTLWRMIDRYWTLWITIDWYWTLWLTADRYWTHWRTTHRFAGYWRRCFNYRHCKWMRREDDYEGWIGKDMEGDDCRLCLGTIPAFGWTDWGKPAQRII